MKRKYELGLINNHKEKAYFLGIGYDTQGKDSVLFIGFIFVSVSLVIERSYKEPSNHVMSSNDWQV